VDLLVFDGEDTPFSEQLRKNGIRILSFSNGTVYNPLFVLKMMRLIRKYDIIHVHLTACQYITAYAKLLSFGGAKLVTTEHNSTNRRRNNILFYLLDKVVYSQYNKIISISDQTRINLEEYIGMKDKMVTIYNGVDLSRFSDVKIIERNGNEVIVTMTAAFRLQKDQQCLIRAISQLPDNYKLQIVGGGEESIEKELKELCNELGVTNRVSFLGIRTDIPTIMSNSDINVLSSHWEGLSLSSIEGMASGRPFVASDVDGLHEIVNGSGVLFKDGDYHQLAREIKKLTEDKAYSKSVADACVKKASEYDISVMASKYNDLYNSLKCEE
jgi:glycosyltransferase involved in cell wall biosynthesis